MMNYKRSGMSVMEISHRFALFQSIIDEAEHNLRTLMNIPDDYEVPFLQGGMSFQFAMMNRYKEGKTLADKRRLISFISTMTFFYSKNGLTDIFF